MQKNPRLDNCTSALALIKEVLHNTAYFDL